MRSNWAFIIPTLSNQAGVRNALSLIKKYYPGAAVIIANNGTGVINALWKNVEIIQFGKNLGFARASNLGAKKAEELFHPEYLIFLNDDVTFENDWVNPCIKTLEKQGWIATSPILLKTDGSIENSGYKVLHKGKVRLITDLKNNETPDGLSGTALVFKTRSFFELGGFDEKFFAYLEDVDLFLRAKKRGMRFGITKSAYITHQGQTTSSRFKTKKAYLDFRNWIFLIAKNWGMKKILLNFPSIFTERLRNLWGIVKSI